MLNPILTKAFDAGAAVAAFTIVKPGSGDSLVVPAAADTDALLGVSTSLAADSGARVDVILEGVAEVLYGGTVTRGDPLTSDANGKAVTATDNGSRIVGFAIVSGVSGDVGSVRLAPGTLAVAA